MQRILSWCRHNLHFSTFGFNYNIIFVCTFILLLSSILISVPSWWYDCTPINHQFINFPLQTSLYISYFAFFIGDSILRFQIHFYLPFINTWTKITLVPFRFFVFHSIFLAVVAFPFWFITIHLVLIYYSPYISPFFRNIWFFIGLILLNLFHRWIMCINLMSCHCYMNQISVHDTFSRAHFFLWSCFNVFSICNLLFFYFVQ